MEPEASFDADLERWLDEQRARDEVRILTVIGVLLTLVFGIVLWFVRWDAVEVSGVDVGPDGRVLAVYGFSCKSKPRVRVAEYKDRIEIRLDQRTHPHDHDCSEYHVVELDRPLENRVVVDARTRREVSVRLLEYSVER